MKLIFLPLLTPIILGCATSGSCRIQSSAATTHITDANPTIEGRLGHPLGTYLTIEGIRAEEGKVGTHSLLVDTVNGAKIAAPVSIWIDNLKNPGLPNAQRCVVRGYESGRMIGIPDSVLAAEKRNAPQAGWQFNRYFIVTSIVEPKSIEMK